MLLCSVPILAHPVNYIEDQISQQQLDMKVRLSETLLPTTVLSTESW